MKKSYNPTLLLFMISYFSDEWVQYDGIVTQEKGIFGSIFSSQKKEWKAHAIECAEILSPMKLKMPQDVAKLQGSFEEFEFLMSGLRKVYFKDFRCYYEEAEFKNKVTKSKLYKTWLKCFLHKAQQNLFKEFDSKQACDCRSNLKAQK